MAVSKRRSMLRTFLVRHAALQYRTSSQSRSHLRRYVKERPQELQVLSGGVDGLITSDTFRMDRADGPAMLRSG